MRGWNFRVLGRPIIDDGEPSVGLFNQELAALEAQGKNTWFTAPWLYAESVTFIHPYLVLMLSSWTPDATCASPAPRFPRI